MKKVIFAFLFGICLAGTISADNSYAVRAIVRKWEKAHNEWDINLLRSLYSREVLYYGHRLPLEECLSDKSRYFRPNDAFRLKVISTLTITNLPNEIIKCEFAKEVFYQGRKTIYPAYLLLSDQVNNFEIIGESDAVTDQNQGYKLDVSHLNPSGIAKTEPETGSGRSIALVILYATCFIFLALLVYMVFRKK